VYRIDCLDADVRITDCPQSIAADFTRLREELLRSSDVTRFLLDLRQQLSRM
jgi:hypothetical protein